MKAEESKEQSKDQENKEQETQSILPSKKVIQTSMKKGDYTAHILVEEVKNLVSKKEGCLPKPVVKITCFEESKRTSQVSDGASDHVYNEHIYFEKDDLPIEVLDSSKIIIEVFDYNNSKREDYFGIYEFDFEYIYTQPNHCLKNFWIALANPEAKDITKVQGYLKLSLSILNDNDERVELNPDPTKDSECIIPPQIKVVYKQLRVYIIKAEELPDMNSASEKKTKRECEGYIECHYMGIVKTTKVVKMENERIIWNQIIEIPISQPAVSQKLIFYVKDKNKLFPDGLVGTIELKVDDIFKEKFKNFRSIDLYGSTTIGNSAINKIMDSNAEIGSRWRGRIYLKIDCFDSDSPTSGIRPIEDDQILSEIAKINRNHQWTVKIKLIDGFYFPKDNEKFSVLVKMQENSCPFDSLSTKRPWNMIKSLQPITLTDSIDEVPDLFIYLLNKDKQIICFQRIKASELYLNDDIMMIKLFPEPTVGKVKELYLSGLLKMKIKIASAIKDKNVDWSDFEDEIDDLCAEINKEPNDNNNNLKPYLIIANVHMTRYLISGDRDGTNDPYTVIRLLDNKQETSVKENCVNGVWNECLYFNDVMMDIKDKSTWPVMLITVMDKDFVGSDLLGYTYLWLSDSSYAIDSTEKIMPKWEQLYLDKSNRPQGQILISFYILSQENSKMLYNIDIVPEVIPYSFEINALGLRDLKPLSFIPVKKPFVSFDLNSINVSSSKGDSLAPIKTLPKDSGSNPNINSVIKFDVKLSKDTIFIPEMQCEVYDYVLGGMLNQLLGIFILSTKDIIIETHSTFEKNIKKAKELMSLPKSKNLDQYPDSSRMQMVEKEEVPESSKPKKVHKDDSGNNLTEPLVDTSVDEGKEMQKIIPQRKKESTVFIVEKKEDLNELYTGPIDNELLRKNKDNSEYYVIKPSFKKYVLPGKKKKDKDYKEYLVENEEEIPSDNLYYPVGFSKNKSNILQDDEEEEKFDEQNVEDNFKNAKHYRRIYGKELENVKELGLGCPFLKSSLVRGKYEDTENKTGIFEAMREVNNKIVKRYKNGEDVALSKASANEDESKHLENIKKSFDIKPYGNFKGLVRIAEKSKMKEYENFINEVKTYFHGKLPLEYGFLTEFDDISRNILIKRNVIIRLYILEMKNLEKRDLLSESDPYIIINLGDVEKVNERKNHQDDKRDCRWYKYYDILADLPGDSVLTIKAMDYDSVFSDDLIGETKIDIEDRFFDQKWRSIKNKPIETRTLYHPDFSTGQGTILMWMNIFERSDRNEMVPWNIEPEPENELQCRLIIWETEKIECMDVEGTSDIYVTAYLDHKEKQTTDIHYRCQTGAASFNWRMLIPIKMPRDNYKLIFHVFDNDILARDDFICGGELDIYKFVKDCNILDIPIEFTRDYHQALSPDQRFKNVEFLSPDEDPEGTKFWVQMTKGGKPGRVLCSLEIVPKWKAEITPVGKGRNEPNVSPYLPPPVGRFQLSMNPIKVFNQLVGPKFRKKCYMIICCALLGLYLVCVVPYMIYHLSSEIVNPFNYISKKSSSPEKPDK